jgi:protein-tyrosine-phosphatase
MLKKIKSLFIVEEEISEQKNKARSADKAIKKTAGEEKEEQLIDEKGNVTKASLDRFLKVLAGAMEEANREGYDYLEFKQAIRSLDELETDEEKRYITSYTLAKTMGAEKDTLKKSAEFYLEILKNEEIKFEDSLKKQIDSKLNNRKTVLNNLNDRKIKKEEQIANLNKEIADIEDKIKAVSKEIDDSAQKVGSVQKSFSAAYDLITQQIRSDIEKIEKYLK